MSEHFGTGPNGYEYVINYLKNQGNIKGAKIFHTSPDDFASILTKELYKDVDFLAGSLDAQVRYLYQSKYFDQFVDMMKSLMPVDTGTLKSSVSSDVLPTETRRNGTMRKVSILDNPYPTVDGKVWRYTTDIIMFQELGYEPHWVNHRYIGAGSKYQCGKSMFVSRFTPFIHLAMIGTFDNWAQIRVDAEEMYTKIGEARRGRTAIKIDHPWNNIPPLTEIQKMIQRQFGTNSGIMKYNPNTKTHEFDFNFAIKQKIKASQKSIRSLKNAKDKTKWIRERQTWVGIQEWKRTNMVLQKYAWLRARQDIMKNITGRARGQSLWNLGRMKNFTNFNYMPVSYFVPPSLNSKLRNGNSAAFDKSYASRFKQK